MDGVRDGIIWAGAWHLPTLSRVPSRTRLLAHTVAKPAGRAWRAHICSNLKRHRFSLVIKSAVPTTRHRAWVQRGRLLANVKEKRCASYSMNRHPSFLYLTERGVLPILRSLSFVWHPQVLVHQCRAGKRLFKELTTSAPSS